MARDVDAEPMRSEEEEAPTGGVRDLDDEAATGLEDAMGFLEVAGGVAQMFEDVEHGDDGAALGADG